MKKIKVNFCNDSFKQVVNFPTIKTLKKGEYFRIAGKKKVYMKGEYDRNEKKYEAIKTDDIYGNPRYLKGSTKVDIDFTY